jgi:hypothetical protein
MYRLKEWIVHVGRLPERSPMHNECKKYALHLEGNVGLIYVPTPRVRTRDGTHLSVASKYIGEAVRLNLSLLLGSDISTRHDG